MGRKAYFDKFIVIEIPGLTGESVFYYEKWSDTLFLESDKRDVYRINHKLSNSVSGENPVSLLVILPDD